MFSRVLVPTDFSDYADTVLDCAGEIPGIGEVYLLHVIDAAHPPRADQLVSQDVTKAQSLLGQKKKAIEGLRLKVHTGVDVIRHGSVAEAITAAAERERVSLVIMGARGKSPGVLMLGSVSSGVLLNTKKNLLIMKYKTIKTPEGTQFVKYCPVLFARVLLPVDFSEPCAKVLAFVLDIRQVEEVVLLNVIEGRGTPGEVAAAEKKLDGMKNDLSRTGLRVSCRVRSGYPPDEIAAAAEDEDVSLIAMGPHGEGWFRQVRDMFVGSVTSAVVRRTQRPVIVVRTG